MASPALAVLRAVRPCTAAASAPAGLTPAKPRASARRIRRQPNLRQNKWTNLSVGRIKEDLGNRVIGHLKTQGRECMESTRIIPNLIRVTSRSRFFLLLIASL